MSYQLPLTLEPGALPATGTLTVQGLYDLFCAQTRIMSGTTFALFTTGSTAPTSDVGPWLKDGAEWMVWSAADGGYVPITVDDQSLKYIISQDEPSPYIFQLWFKLDADGQGEGIYLYYNGAWTEIYKKFGGNQFKVRMSGDQDLVFGSAGTIANRVIEFDTEDYDQDGTYDTTVWRFVAPKDGYYHFTGVVQIYLKSGSPTSSTFYGSFLHNNNPADSLIILPDDVSTNQRILTGSADFQLNKGASMQIGLSITVDATATWSVDQSYSRFSGFRTG